MLKPIVDRFRHEINISPDASSPWDTGTMPPISQRLSMSRITARGFEA
jgi:hypothetical protein